MMWGSAWKTDRRNACDWLRRMDSAVTLKQTEAMARHLVAEHWDAIVRVAEALAAEGELSGARIEALFHGDDFSVSTAILLGSPSRSSSASSSRSRVHIS
jgi:hypothetical protein